MGTATFVHNANTSDPKQDARYYTLDPEFRGVGGVIVSAVDPEGNDPEETFIFPGDVSGVTSWTVLPGSFIGAKDHERALAGLGYEVR